MPPNRIREPQSSAYAWENPPFVAEDQATRELLENTRIAALGADHPILIVGEIGVGKSHLARYIHRISARSEGELAFIDCGTLPQDLDNLLFGHRQGAFTGAVRSLPGRLSAANGGTLVLDDVERLTHRHQDLFHRMVVDGKIVPLGTNTVQTIDCRIIATTNKDLYREADRGTMKRDFLSRLDYFILKVPSLSERLDDIPALCESLLNRNIGKLIEKRIWPKNRPMPSFDPDCWPALKARHIVDNVRGLDKIIVRLLATLQGRDQITPRDLEVAAPAFPEASGPWFDQPRTLREVREQAERRYIHKVCVHTDFNVQQAARILGVSAKHVYAKLKQYGLNRS